jgi:uncharacterized alpha-E superfamily protein
VNLLARYAECIFWMARYMERAENIARLLDVHETFARDSRGATNWLAIVQLNADEKPFFTRYDKADAQSVAAFYVLDQENPTRSCPPRAWRGKTPVFCGRGFRPRCGRNSTSSITS